MWQDADVVNVAIDKSAYVCWKIQQSIQKLL